MKSCKLPGSILFVVIICICSQTPEARERVTNDCVPTYQGVIVPSVRTSYKPKITGSIVEKIGTQRLTRIFHSWERIKVKVHASIVIDSYTTEKCQLTVKSKSDWFGECKIVIVKNDNREVLNEILWRPVTTKLSGGSDENVKILTSGKSVGAETSILPLLKSGRPLEPGYYRIKIQCDMNRTSGLIGGCSENCRKILRIRKTIGTGVIQVVIPKTKLEFAEEEMHKAYWKGVDTDEAIVHLKKALELDPDGTQAIKWLSHAYMKKGEIDKARPLVKRCIELDPNCRSCKRYQHMLQTMYKDDPK